MPKGKNKHNAAVGSSVERDDARIKKTGEVFSPMSLVMEMVNEIPEETLRNPDSTFCDNSCGSGNFLIGLRDKLLEYHTEEHIVNNMLFAVDIMEDNVAETCRRLGVPGGHAHYVCANALTYDYSFGQPQGVLAFL